MRKMKIKKIRFCEEQFVDRSYIEYSFLKNYDFWWLLGARLFQRTLEPMTWCMQQDFCPLKLRSTNAPCLTCSLRQTGYFTQRYVNLFNIEPKLLQYFLMKQFINIICSLLCTMCMNQATLLLLKFVDCDVISMFMLDFFRISKNVS